MVASSDDFYICYDFLISIMRNNLDIDNQDELLYLYLEQIYGQNKFSIEIRSKLSKKCFGYSSDELLDKLSLLEGIKNRVILSTGRFIYTLGLSKYQRDIYLNLMDSFCNNQKTCKCCKLILPYKYRGIKWKELYLDGLKKIFPNAKEFLIIDTDKVEKNLGLTNGTISRVLKSGMQCSTEKYFYQKIILDKNTYHGTLNKNGKIKFNLFTFLI